jgi:hypothetical protein
MNGVVKEKRRGKERPTEEIEKVHRRTAAALFIVCWDPSFLLVPPSNTTAADLRSGGTHHEVDGGLAH